MLSAVLILAVMVIPFTSSVAREVLKAVPGSQREAAYALGATRWEAIRAALFYARTGIIGAVMLGFGRALGETMAVTMVIGNNPQITASLFAPQYTMAAVLANEFTEAADDLYLAALIEIGLVLFVITLIVNTASRLAHLEHEPADRGAARDADPGRRRDGRGASMKHDAVRRWISTIVVWLCGLSVLVALVPLAFILFFVVSAGRPGPELGLLHPDAGPGRRAGRRDGQRHRGHADAGRASAPLFAVPVGVISGVYIAEFPGDQARHDGALRGGHAERRAVDRRSGSSSTAIAVLPFQPVQRAGGRAGARDHDDPDHHAHDRGAAQARAAGACGKARWRSARRAAGPP